MTHEVRDSMVSAIHSILVNRSLVFSRLLSRKRRGDKEARIMQKGLGAPIAIA